MNRGSTEAETRSQARPQAGFNEAPIHESGKSVLRTQRFARPISSALQ